MRITNFISALGDTAVDVYRARLQAQLEQHRLGALQLSLLLNGALAAVGMATDVIALQLRIHALQHALEEAIDAGDLEAAEGLRAQMVAMLQEPPASARLLQTLAEYLPALVAKANGHDARVIEGEVA